MGSVVGSIFGGGSDAAEDAADAAKLAYRPYDIDTELGSANLSGRTFSAFLSPEFRGLLDTALGEAAGDVNQLEQMHLDRLNTFAAKDEADARRMAEERLFRSGRLGTYGGSRELGQVEEAIARAQLDRQLQARSLALSERQTALGNAMALGQLPSTFAGMALNRNPAQIAAGLMQGAAADSAGQAAFTSSLLSPLLQPVQGALSSAVGSGMSWLGSTIGGIFGGPAGAAIGGTAGGILGGGFSTPGFNIGGFLV